LNACTSFSLALLRIVEPIANGKTAPPSPFVEDADGEIAMLLWAARRRRIHGAQGRDRTTDTAIFSRMLYQLSYLGVPVGLKGGRERRFIVRQSGSVHHASHLTLRVAQPRNRPQAKRARHSPRGGGGRFLKTN
jgi:hypothetical protein